MDKGIMFLGMGFELVAMCLGGYYLGEYLDQYFAWNMKSGAYLIVILLIGWFIHLIYLIKRFEAEDDSSK